MAERKVKLKIHTGVEGKGVEQVERLKSNFREMTTRVLALAKSVDKLTSYTDKMTVSQRVLNHTFGSATENMNSYISSLSKMTGISEVSISNSTALFGQLSTSIGMSTQMAGEFSKALDDISARISILYGTDYTRASTAILGAMKGEVRTLATITGISVKSQTQQNLLDVLGIDAKVSDLNAVNSAMLKYIVVAKQVMASDQAMAEYAESVAYQKQVLKNQVKELATAFGNVLYPILQKILPVLNGVMIAVTAIINAIAGVVATALGTSRTVKESTDAMNDYGNAIAGASQKAAKSLRSFDKLNNITTPSSSSVGGLSVNPKIYEEFKKISDKMLDIKIRAHEIADEILKWLGFTKDTNGQLKWSANTLLKNIYDWWSKLNVLVKLFVGFGLVKLVSDLYKVSRRLLTNVIERLTKSKFWSVSKVLIDSIKKEGLVDTVKDLAGAMTPLEKSLGIMAGFVVTFQGIRNISEGLKLVKDESSKLDGVLQLLSGTLEVMGGLALVAGFLTGNPALIIGGAIATIGGAVGELAIHIKRSSDNLSDFHKIYGETKDSVDKGLTSYTNQLEAYRDLADELENLIDENGKVKKGYEERVSYILNELNNAFGTEYKLVDSRITQNGEYVKSIQKIEAEIDKYIAKLRGQYILEKYEDVRNEALDKKNEKIAKLNSLEEEYTKQKEKLIEKYGLQSDEVETLTRKYEEQKNSIEKEYDDAMVFLENYGKLSQAVATGNMDDIEKYANLLYSENNKNVERYTNNIKSYFESIVTEINNTTSLTTSVTSALERDMPKSGKSAGTSWKNAFVNAVNAKNLELKTSTAGNITVTQRYNGGFVDSGEMFIARENGIPEMVGRIGRRTAVANNDQIVEAIAAGVARANATKSDKVVIEATGDSSGLLDFITFKQKDRDRQYGL